jgi:hypothetical protein
MDIDAKKEFFEEVTKLTRRKPRKKYPRETTVRFTTDEAKILLMGMNYAANRHVFVSEGMDITQKAGAIMGKLKDRIEKERAKKDKVLVSVAGGD